jgi:hypothetical protein
MLKTILFVVVMIAFVAFIGYAGTDELATRIEMEAIQDQ